MRFYKTNSIESVPHKISPIALISGINANYYYDEKNYEFYVMVNKDTADLTSFASNEITSKQFETAMKSLGFLESNQTYLEISQNINNSIRD
jgi:hypothetical protein